ncbi:MAG: hypothetical protein AVDCRST_MAG26-59, partial [uncultured Chloroflexia bacterium]
TLSRVSRIRPCLPACATPFSAHHTVCCGLAVSSWSTSSPGPRCRMSGGSFHASGSRSSRSISPRRRPISARR